MSIAITTNGQGWILDSGFPAAGRLFAFGGWWKPTDTQSGGTRNWCQQYNGSEYSNGDFRAEGARPDNNAASGGPELPYTANAWHYYVLRQDYDGDGNLTLYSSIVGEDNWASSAIAATNMNTPPDVSFTLLGGEYNDSPIGLWSNVLFYADYCPPLEHFLAQKYYWEPVFTQGLFSHFPMVGIDAATAFRDTQGRDWRVRGSPDFDREDPPLIHRAPTRRIYIPPPPVGPTPVISTLTPDWFADGQPNNEITGSGFEAPGPNSKVEVTDGSTTVEATYGAWSDTSITGIVYDTTNVNLGGVTVIVTNNSQISSTPEPATHLATLPSSGPVTSDDLNARVNRAAGTPINPSRDAEFTAHVSDTNIGDPILIPSAGVS